MEAAVGKAHPVSYSGLPREMPLKEYHRWVEDYGFGPCGVLSWINHQDHGFSIVSCEVETSQGRFLHYVNLDQEGHIFDEANPWGKVTYHDLVDEDYPEIISDGNIQEMRKRLRRPER